MRNVILTAWAAVLGCSVASGQISLVNATQCGPGAFPGTVCTIPATGNGHLMVVAWASAEGAAPTIGSVTDNAGNTYLEAGNARAVDGNFNAIDIWYAKNSQAGATSITVTPNPSGVSGAAMVWEFSGVDTVSPLDQTSVLNNQGVTGSPAGAPVSITSPVEVVISVISPQWWLNSLQSGNSFTSDWILNTGPSQPYTSGWAHLITSSTGTYAAAWSTGADLYTSSTVSFKSGNTVSACDLNADGTVNILDVQLATDMDLSEDTCTAPGGYCNPVFVQNVTNTALGQPCTLTVLGVPASPLNFGNVAVGGSGVQNATLTVTGSGSTTISQINASPAAFTVSGPSLPLTLPAGQTAPFSVTFNPSTAGSVAGSISIVTASTSNALNSPLSVSVSGVGVNSKPHSASLSWTASTSSNVVSYNVYRITSSSPTAPATPYPVLASNLTAATICSGTTCSYTDSTVVAGTTYWYYATAVNSSNTESVPSNTGEGITPTP